MSEPDRMTWRRKLVPFLIANLKGTDDEKEATLAVITEAISLAHNEGVWDAADIARRCAEAMPASPELKIVADALDDYHARGLVRPLPAKEEGK